MTAIDSSLLAEAVDVWHLELTPQNAVEDSLSPDELERVRRFRMDSKRIQFTAARSQMRRILARYVDADPSELRFAYGEHGKPFLPEHSELEFNLSHSGTAGLLGVTRETPIGVDVELTKPGRRFEGIAGRFFAADERDALLRLDRARRVDAFYRAWASKEAYLKAWGTGLSFPSNRFTIEYADAPLRLVTTAMPDDRAEDWRLCAVKTVPGYSSALCYRGESRWLRHFAPGRGCSEDDSR